MRIASHNFLHVLQNGASWECPSWILGKQQALPAMHGSSRRTPSLQQPPLLRWKSAARQLMSATLMLDRHELLPIEQSTAVRTEPSASMKSVSEKNEQGMAFLALLAVSSRNFQLSAKARCILTSAP